MGFSLFKKIVDECAERRPGMSVALHKDGEPLLHPNFVDMVRYASDQGIWSQFHTNGTFLTEDVQAQLLQIPRLKKVVVSVYGNDEEEYSRVTQRKGQFDVVTGHMVKLIENKLKLKTRTLIEFLMPENEELAGVELRDFVERWASHSDLLTINKFRNWAGVFEHRVAQKRIPCLNLWEHPAINWNGDMMICCQTFGFLEDAIIGNVDQSPIREIWRTSELLRRLREQHSKAEFNKFPICDKCTSWKNYPDIWFPGARKARRFLDGLDRPGKPRRPCEELSMPTGTDRDSAKDRGISCYSAID